MKKLIAASLSLAMLFCLTACGGSKDDDTPIEKPSAVATQAKTEATTSDVIQYDPFAEEEFSIEVKQQDTYDYPSSIGMKANYNQQFYNITIDKADSESVELKVTVDNDELKEYFDYIGQKYEVIREENTYTIPVNEFQHCCLNKSDYSEDVVEKSEEKIQGEMDTFRIDSDRELIAIYAGVVKDSTSPFIKDYTFCTPHDAAYRSQTEYDSGGFKLWFVYKLGNGTFCIPAAKAVVQNGNLKQTLNNVGLSMDYYESREEAKRAIEDYIAKYDNVKLEELEIPEALK